MPSLLQAFINVLLSAFISWGPQPWVACPAHLGRDPGMSVGSVSAPCLSIVMASSAGSPFLLEWNEAQFWNGVDGVKSFWWFFLLVFVCFYETTTKNKTRGWDQSCVCPLSWLASRTVTKHRCPKRECWSAKSSVMRWETLVETAVCPVPTPGVGVEFCPQSLILTGVYQDVRCPGEEISVCGKTTGMYHSDDTFAHTEPGSELA